ncbi:hypothetical protein HanRHA438_Chr14g0630431 [Helianthus annuus]|nr:hypothetical protein HanRHA438_Chr14g0630431 [Helianthus annuus]
MNYVVKSASLGAPTAPGKNWLTRAMGFWSCIRVRRCGHTRVQPNSSSETHFCTPPPPARG